jgi:hypothetical protein
MPSRTHRPGSVYSAFDRIETEAEPAHQT